MQRVAAVKQIVLLVIFSLAYRPLSETNLMVSVFKNYVVVLYLKLCRSRPNATIFLVQTCKTVFNRRTCKRSRTGENSRQFVLKI